MGGRTSLSWKLNNGQIQFRFICLWKLISHIYKLGITENSREMFWMFPVCSGNSTKKILNIPLFYCGMLCVWAPQYKHVYVYISTHTDITYTYLYLCIDVRSYINTVLTYKKCICIGTSKWINRHTTMLRTCFFVQATESPTPTYTHAGRTENK